MASTLDRTPESRPGTPRGHGTRDLGPSDSSDTGSDIVGGPGIGGLDLDLDRGTASDPERGGATAGPDVGDSGLDSDSDASGTGENIAAGRDPLQTDQDVMPDRIIEDLALEDADLLAPDGEGAAAESGRDSISDAAAVPGEEVPTLDAPPPLPDGGDTPVADRVPDAEPVRGERRIRGAP
jgi:hypothetical protein